MTCVILGLKLRTVLCVLLFFIVALALISAFTNPFEFEARAGIPSSKACIYGSGIVIVAVVYIGDCIRVILGVILG